MVEAFWLPLFQTLDFIDKELVRLDHTFDWDPFTGSIAMALIYINLGTSKKNSLNQSNHKDTDKCFLKGLGT